MGGMCPKAGIWPGGKTQKLPSGNPDIFRTKTLDMGQKEAIKYLRIDKSTICLSSDAFRHQRVRRSSSNMHCPER